MVKSMSELFISRQLARLHKDLGHLHIAGVYRWADKEKNNLYSNLTNDLDAALSEFLVTNNEKKCQYEIDKYFMEMEKLVAEYKVLFPEVLERHMKEIMEEAIVNYRKQN